MSISETVNPKIRFIWKLHRYRWRIVTTSYGNAGFPCFVPILFKRLEPAWRKDRHHLTVLGLPTMRLLTWSRVMALDDGA
jgi:hypothetical protein